MKETEVFAKVIAENDPEKRSRLVNELCRSDDDLRTRVQKLLAAHDDPNSFFDDPVLANHSREFEETFALKTGLAQPGTQIGPYKLLQQIGEGGMGLVFMAEQTEPVNRRVALKVIKPGMDSRQVIARFEAERQALAMMNHPNIAKVFEAGSTDQGHPYFVMELVNGVSITEYCDQEKLTTSERLKMFTAVCRAIQHAHQKGVIHRDLKPNNILVAEFDGKPVPKVIDFGVAKAMGSQLTEKTLFTEFGQVIGTLEFMSPEQARRNQMDVDTRSDIYSLGIVLYMLLTGETPFGKERFQKAAWDEMLKIIREEEPPLPSVKIDSSQSLDQIARHRSIEPSKLSALVRGDLDWIVLKTLDKDRNRRYASAGDLADDINRHLGQHPVAARPPSALDFVSKYVRRNRKFVTTVLIAFLALCYLAGLGAKAARDLKKRNARIVQATQAAEFSIASAINAPIGDQSPWETAAAHCQRIEESLSDGAVSGAIRENAEKVIQEFEFRSSERQLAIQIEEVVIQAATHPDLASWQKMEQQMRGFFRQHGFDLDNEQPAAIGRRIRADRSSVLWADLLELWIATRGQMAGIGGPKLTAAIMQPWADAIYVADDDPVRTGIRKFVYTPPRKKETLNELVKDVDLRTLPPRTLSWLATCYNMVDEFQKCDQVFETALQTYPRDLMLAFDYGYVLFHQKRYQESTRMFHRCIAIRSDVSGIWKSLSMALEKLGEDKAAQKALQRSNELAVANHKQNRRDDLD